MIFITGDTHGTYDIGKLFKFQMDHPNLTKDDFMIICGDFGGIWDAASAEESISLYAKFSFTTLFIDGNHENFDMLGAYPVEIWHGGKVHRISPDLIHLMRGQVFEIEGKTFFTFGGATSIDKFRRREGISWWPQEIPTYEELDEGMANLKRYNNTVDFVVTHSCDEKALWYPPLRERGVKMGTFPENSMLSCFEDILTYGHWYFGHYHLDGDLTENKTVLYLGIRRIV